MHVGSVTGTTADSLHKCFVYRSIHLWPFIFTVLTVIAEQQEPLFPIFSIMPIEATRTRRAKSGLL
jgi:hypothetical protein